MSLTTQSATNVWAHARNLFTVHWYVSNWMEASILHQARIWGSCVLALCWVPSLFTGLARFNGCALVSIWHALWYVCDVRGFHSLPPQSGTPQELQDTPLNPSLTVSIDQGTPTSMNDGNVDPTNLSENRFFQRVEGAQSASVSASCSKAHRCWGRCTWLYECMQKWL